METAGIFNETIGILEKALDLRSSKHNLIVSNIANVDTPNYKAFDMFVEEELKKVVGADKNIELRNTQPVHLTVREGRLDKVKSEFFSSPQLTLRGDGNSVDIDRVMATLAKNSLMYKTSAQILSKKFQGLKTAIQGGNK